MANEPTERKTVKLLKSTWERIANYRFDRRVSTETEALQQIVDAGLRQVERAAKSGIGTAKRKAKR